MPLVAGQLRTLTLAPVLYLVIIAVVVFAAVFSKKASQRQAALVVLRLLIPRRNPLGRSRRPPPGH
jgi:hypothetical protein